MSVPNIVITNQGLTALNLSLANGDPLDITTYKVSQQAGVVGHATDTVMIGTVVRSASIASIAAISTSQVRVTITIPAGVPTTGDWTLRELGIYLSNGQLFAHGPMSPEINKGSTFGTKFYIIIAAVGIGSVINVTVLEETSIPAIASVHGLPAPSTSVQTTIAVLDALPTKPHSNYSPVIAIRYGNAWGFTGYVKVADYTIPAGATVSQFSLDPTVNTGFWLDHNEIVIVHVLTGSGVGQSRKMIWSTSTNAVTALGANFTSLPVGSLVAIWKSLGNDIPVSSESTPTHYVLGPDDPHSLDYVGPKWVDPAGWDIDAGKTRLMLRTEVELLYALKTTIFPIGGIIMWNGSSATIPAGWALCDGSSGTPNLTDRFVVGVSSTKPLGSIGGTANSTLVAHTHTYDDLYDIENGALASNTALGADSLALGITKVYTPLKPGTSTHYAVRGAHGDVDDDNNVMYRMASETDSVGSSGTNKNLPPYYALAFIMKLS